ncbi:MAG: hypothetical protein AAGJ97_15810, partial [Planctomycetota bacterium]
FSLADLPGDRELFPERLETIASSTGLRPVAAFAVGRDRDAARAGRLTYERVAIPDGLVVEDVGDTDASDPAAWLATVSASPVKEKTFAESVAHVLDPAEGLPGYLDRVRAVSSRTAASLAGLTDGAVVDGSDWPAVPSAVIVDEVRDWWGGRRKGWAQWATAPYKAVGRGWRMLTQTSASRNADRLSDYKAREWAAVVDVVGELGRRLGTLEADLDESGLVGTTRAEQLEALRARHADSDPAGELSDLVAGELTRLKAEHPTQFAWLERVDTAVTIGRPAVSAGLFFTFGGADLVLSAATGSLAAAAADLATGGGAAGPPGAGAGGGGPAAPGGGAGGPRPGGAENPPPPGG